MGRLSNYSTKVSVYPEQNSQSYGAKENIYPSRKREYFLNFETLNPEITFKTSKVSNENFISGRNPGKFRVSGVSAVLASPSPLVDDDKLN